MAKTTKKPQVTVKITKTAPTKNVTTQEKEKTYIYEVEEGVVLMGTRNSNVNDKFPFPIMKPGDSFLIPPNDPAAKNPNVLHYAAKQYAKMKPGFIITTRLQLNKSRRVWRLK